MKIQSLVIVFIFSACKLNAQENYLYQLISAPEFLSLTNSVEFGSTFLKKKGFKLDQIKKNRVGIEYHDYRLDNLNPNIDLYDFDIFAITDEVSSMTYLTCNEYHWIGYKNRLRTYGAELVDGKRDRYSILTSEWDYSITFSKFNHGNIMNYRITVVKYKRQ